MMQTNSPFLTLKFYIYKACLFVLYSLSPPSKDSDKVDSDITDYFFFFDFLFFFFLCSEDFLFLFFFFFLGF